MFATGSFASSVFCLFAYWIYSILPHLKIVLRKYCLDKPNSTPNSYISLLYMKGATEQGGEIPKGQLVGVRN